MKSCTPERASDLHCIYILTTKVSGFFCIRKTAFVVSMMSAVHQPLEIEYIGERACLKSCLIFAVTYILCKASMRRIGCQMKTHGLNGFRLHKKEMMSSCYLHVTGSMYSAHSEI